MGIIGILITGLLMHRNAGMRVLLFGFDPQWQEIAAADCIINIDNNIQDIPLNSYDAIVLCSNNLNAKINHQVIRYALVNCKHILITYPLWGQEDLYGLAKNNTVVCSTVYNYAFDSQIMRIKNLLQSDTLGKIYHYRLSASSAHSCGDVGALTILGPHILYLLHGWFGKNFQKFNFSIINKKSFKHVEPDYVIFADFNSVPSVEVEITTLNTENNLTCAIISEFGIENIVLTYNPHMLWSLAYINFKEKCLSNDTAQDCTIERVVADEIQMLNQENIFVA